MSRESERVQVANPLDIQNNDSIVHQDIFLNNLSWRETKAQRPRHYESAFSYKKLIFNTRKCWNSRNEVTANLWYYEANTKIKPRCDDLLQKISLSLSILEQETSKFKIRQKKKTENALQKKFCSPDQALTS